MDLHAADAPHRFSLQRILSWLYAVYAWSLFIVLVTLFGGAIVIARRPSIGRRIARAGTSLLFRLAAIPVSVSGLANLPEQPHILLVNHTSFLDGFALLALLPPVPGYSFAVSQEFGYQRVFCSLLRGIGTVVLHRPGWPAGEPGVRKIFHALEAGKSLIVFPEGGFRSEAGLMPFHSGAFVAAATANVPVVVAGLNGVRSLLPLKRWMPRRSSVFLKIGPPLHATGNGQEAIHELMASARASMAELSQESAGPKE